MTLSRVSSVGRRMSLLAALALWGCAERSAPTDVTPPPTGPAAALVVSSPVPAPSGTAVSEQAAGSSQSGDSLAWVSMPPGSFPAGRTATLSNRTVGAAITEPIIDGGLDPTPIPARTGDTIVVQLTDSLGTTAVAFLTVKPRRAPVVTRTDPPPGRSDVPLNAVIIVVANEPVDTAAVHKAVRLFRNGVAVPGVARVRPGANYIIEFATDATLIPATDYQLVVTTALQDLTGETLQAEVDAPFHTVGIAALSFTSVVAGGDHSCAVAADGAAYCWGANGIGQLGTGDSIGSPIPRPVYGRHAFLEIAASDDRTCARTPTPYCWGDTLSPEPQQLQLSGQAFPDLTSLAVGPSRVCGVTSGNLAYCAGWWTIGGSGLSENGNPRDTMRFVQSSVGRTHDCFIALGGAAYCWGFNSSGELGDTSLPATAVDTFVGRPASLELRPVSGGLTFLAVAAGGSHTCAIAVGGTAYCWGSNDYGELGNGRTASGTTATAVAGGLTFASLSAAEYTTCGITTSGAAYCWGNNSYGALGDGTQTWRDTPVPVAGGLRFASISAGKFHTCGMTTDGKAWCWGSNASGEVGDGTSGNLRLTPVMVAGQR